ARNIVFSCQYHNPHLEPLEIICELLLEFTQFTLAPTLPADFPGNLFDYYLENAPPAFEDPDISPIPRSSTEATSSFITPQLENLDDPFSLPLYNEDTTVINFPPRRNSLPSSPLVDIPLRTPTRISSPAPTTASSSNPLTRFINFITPGRFNNPPPPPHCTLFTNISTQPHHPPPLIINPTIDPIHSPDTVYPIHPEETNLVLFVIVDINSPNEEPIRTPTPEALLVNPPDPVNEAPLPFSPPI
ncbi:19023_t:CDS:2, partial [Gigaspora margarita]